MLASVDKFETRIWHYENLSINIGCHHSIYRGSYTPHASWTESLPKIGRQKPTWNVLRLIQYNLHLEG